MIPASTKPEVQELIAEIFDGPPGIKLGQLGKAVKESTEITQKEIDKVGKSVNNVDKQFIKMNKMNKQDERYDTVATRFSAEMEVLGKRQTVSEAQGRKSHMLAIELDDVIQNVAKKGKKLQKHSDNSGYKLMKAKSIAEYFMANSCYLDDSEFQKRVTSKDMDYFLIVHEYVQPYSWAKYSRIVVLCIQCFTFRYVKRDYLKPDSNIYLDSRTLVPLFFELKDTFGDCEDSMSEKKNRLHKIME